MQSVVARHIPAAVVSGSATSPCRGSQIVGTRGLPRVAGTWGGGEGTPGRPIRGLKNALPQDLHASLMHVENRHANIRQHPDTGTGCQPCVVRVQGCGVLTLCPAGGSSQHFSVPFHDNRGQCFPFTAFQNPLAHDIAVASRVGKNDMQERLQVLGFRV